MKKRLVFQESKVARGKFRLSEASNVFNIDKILNVTLSLQEIEDFVDGLPTHVDVVFRSVK